MVHDVDIVDRDTNDLVDALFQKSVMRADEAWQMRHGAGRGIGPGQTEDHHTLAGDVFCDVDFLRAVLAHVKES